MGATATAVAHRQYSDDNNGDGGGTTIYKEDLSLMFVQAQRYRKGEHGKGEGPETPANEFRCWIVVLAVVAATVVIVGRW